MIDFSTPLSGLERATSTLNKVAARIAKGSSASADTVDLSADAVALLVARQNFESNIKSLQTADQLSQSLLKILG
jgi:flagellar hook protein FlgE